jgi:hypothetical protein
MSCTNPNTACVAIAILIALCSPAGETIAGEDKAVPAQNATGLDQPGDAELSAAYQRDRSNQKVQSWAQYRGWVQTFYKGNLMSDGWRKFGELTASMVKSATTRQAVIARINELGRIVGLEWAKDSSVRKINTADLRRWNDIMAAARQRDDGSGQQITDALVAVRRMADIRR